MLSDEIAHGVVL